MSGLMRGAWVVALVTITWAMAAGAWADPISVPLDPEPFSYFGVTGTATSQKISNYNYSNLFAGQILSQAFTREGGGYLYLYQVDNYGPSVLEVFSVAPMCGFEGTGYLTSGEPLGFLMGGKEPLGASYDTEPPNPVLSFGYPGFLGAYLGAGKHTRALYVLSPNPPEIVEAYVIDSGVAVGEVWAPVPEPATMALLVAGGAGMIVMRRRRA